MKPIRACILTVVIVVLFAAQTETSEPTLQVPSRSETNVVIQIEGYGKYSMRYPTWPYVDTNGCAYLLPGEEFTIEFDVLNGGLLKPKWVEKRSKGKDAITVKFSNDGKITTLTTKSYCSRIVTMKCRHRQAGAQDLFVTGLNPIKPDMFSADSWSPEIVSLRLFDFRIWDDYDQAFKHER